MIVKCCMFFVVAIGVAISVILTYGKDSNLMVGNAPYFMNEQRITEKTIPNLEGKTIIVTGANAGLGKSTVKHLSVNGATVIMGCRSNKKCTKAKQEILREVEDAKALNTKIDYSKFRTNKLITMELDLGSFDSIKKFATKFLKENKKLDSLILNAGIMHTKFGLTKDGIEQQIGVNHFGHFYLTKLLLPMIEKSQPSTIVSVSSVGHHMTYSEGIKSSIAKMNSEADYDSFAAYGQSKLANILFAQELAEKLKGKSVFVNAVHPGGVNTELARHYPDWVLKVIKGFTAKFPNTAFFESDLASLVEVYAAVSPEIFEKKITGKYMVPIGQIVTPNDHAFDKKLQKMLWNLSEQFVKDHS